MAKVVRIMEVHPRDAFYDCAKIVGATGVAFDIHESHIRGYYQCQFIPDVSVFWSRYRQTIYFMAVQFVEV